MTLKTVTPAGDAVPAVKELQGLTISLWLAPLQTLRSIWPLFGMKTPFLLA